MQVRVFRNLTRKCYSIQARIPRKGWRTVAHAEAVEVIMANFHVSQAGRDSVLRTGKKVIHAWVQGYLSAWTGQTAPAISAAKWLEGTSAMWRRLGEACHDLEQRQGYRVRYVPSLADSFFYAGNGPIRPIHSASYARLDRGGVTVA